MRVALPPLFLLIGSKVINVVYSAALVCIPIDYVTQLGQGGFVLILPHLNWVNVYPLFFPPLTLVLDFHHDSRSAFQALLVLHTPVS